MPAFYWERHPDGPFATLIAVATNYLHPENYDLDLLRDSPSARTTKRCRSSSPNSVRQLADPSQLPGDELSESVQYGDGSDEAFLRRLWHDLYGDETP